MVGTLEDHGTFEQFCESCAECRVWGDGDSFVTVTMPAGLCVDMAEGGNLVCGWSSTETIPDTTERTITVEECGGPRFLAGPPRTKAAMHAPEAEEGGEGGGAAVNVTGSGVTDIAEGEGAPGDGAADLFGSVAKGMAFGF